MSGAGGASTTASSPGCDASLSSRSPGCNVFGGVRKESASASTTGCGCMAFSGVERLPEHVLDKVGRSSDLAGISSSDSSFTTTMEPGTAGLAWLGGCSTGSPTGPCGGSSTGRRARTGVSDPSTSLSTSRCTKIMSLLVSFLRNAPDFKNLRRARSPLSSCLKERSM